MGELLVGIDIGGTKIATSAADRSGNVIARTRRPTDPLGDPRADVSRVADDVRAIVRDAGARLEDVMSLGVSVPGPLDPTGQRLLAPPNLPGWEDVPLRDWLAGNLGISLHRVHLENDANAAALAEWQFGAARGYQDVVYLTMSTGVGGGLILGGRLHRGAGHAAGEVGHLRVSFAADAELCSCGRRGCLEAYTGGAAWTRRLRAVTPAESAVATLAEGVERVTPEHVVSAAKQGDAFAKSELERFNHYLARGITTLAYALAPQVFVLGTIAVAAGEALCFEPLRAAVRAQLWEVIAEPLEIIPAALGDTLPDRAGIGVAREALTGQG